MKLWKLVTAAIALILSTSVNAALVERLGGLAYYDDVADLTWLADANYAQTSGAQTSGDDERMSWTEANTWVSSLIIDGVDGWRLADSDTCIDFNCTDSEMGNLFYNVLGGIAGSSITTTHNANYDLFSHVEPNYYWSATEHEINTARAFAFNMSDGYQYNQTKINGAYAWAVQSGDISAVPVPAAVWLFGSGLIGLVGLARRKKA